MARRTPSAPPKAEPGADAGGPAAERRRASRLDLKERLDSALSADGHSGDGHSDGRAGMCPDMQSHADNARHAACATDGALSVQPERCPALTRARAWQGSKLSQAKVRDATRRHLSKPDITRTIIYRYLILSSWLYCIL